MLLLHGEPQHWYAWRHVIPALSERYRVICPDLRGMGWSDAPTTGYDKEQLATDVIGVIEALQLEEVRLVGHDYGCIVGFLVCLRAPDRIARFLALNAFHPWLSLFGLLANAPREWYQLLTGAPILGPAVIRRSKLWPFLMRAGPAGPSIWTPGEPEHYADRVRDRARARGTSRITRALPVEVLQWRRRYQHRRLTVPTRMLVGKRDRLISPQMVRGLSQHADDLTVEVLHDAGHWLPNECPDVIIGEARSFLR